jgi:hypothetical protein
MKINFVTTIIALAISLLLAYGFYSFSDSDNKLLFCVGSFVFIAATLIMTIGVSLELPRTTANVRVVSGIFFTIALASNITFLFIKFSIPGYIITNGILLLIFLLLAYSVNRAKQ